MKVNLISWTPNPEQVVAAAARTCYSPGTVEETYKKVCISTEETEKFIEKITSLGHDSVLEHISFTFGIDEVSRVLLAQLTRHRIASFSVQSQRYVKYDTLASELSELFVIPAPILESSNEAKDFYLGMLDKICQGYELLVLLLMEEGLSKTEAAENARYILPGAMKTNLVMTMNARELKHFFELRCCNRAQEEIRELAWTMLRCVKDICPAIFSNCGPKCVKGQCPEGAMSCQRNK